MNIKDIINQIEENGFALLDNFLQDNEFESLKNFVDKKINIINKNFFLVDKSQTKIFIENNDLYNKFYKLFVELIDGNNIDENEKIYRVLRYIKGEQSEEESFKFHFDAHHYTILIPIHIPNRDGHDNGDLLIIPNLRKLHKNIFINVLQKLFYQSSFYRSFLKNNLRKKTKKLQLKTGNIYIINGFRSLHGNLNIHNEDQRATILLHFKDVIKDSKLIKINRFMKQFIESKNIKT